MPIQIVRSDITKVRADAIVNSTSPELICGGLGVDASIHAAAGPALGETLAEIGGCEIGSAVMTEAFELHRCRYIFHAVAPVYIDGQHNEEALLRRCYRKIFALAEEYNCKSIAMPILSAGAYGYPKADAYRIATEEARGYLLWNNDIEISVVLFGRQLTEIARAVEKHVDEFITDDYQQMNREDLMAYYRSIVRREPEDLDGQIGLPGTTIHSTRDRILRNNAAVLREAAGEDEPAEAASLEESIAEERAREERSTAGRDAGKKLSETRRTQEKLPGEKFHWKIGETIFAPAREKGKEDAEEQKACFDPDDHRLHREISFGAAVDKLLEKKKMDIGDFYVAANINKAAMYKMRQVDSEPKKYMALACAIGLRLNIEETEELLRYAGYCLSESSGLDLVVAHYIRQRVYDIFAINAVLADLGLHLLGSK